MTSPEDRLERLAGAYQVSRAVQVAARLGLGRRLAERPWTIAELAGETGTEAGALGRLLSFLTVLEVVEELPDGRYGPTPLSNLLSTIDHPAQGQEAWAVWGALPQSLRTGKSPFEQVVGRTFAAQLAADTERRRAWQARNNRISRQLAPLVEAALELTGGETLVDVGGGQGALLAELLRRQPGCRGVLVDLPGATAGADETLAAAGVAGRCRTIEADARREVPPGGDVYLLCRVLFNLDDASALAVLERCCKALSSDDGRVALVETLLPPAGNPSRHRLAAADLHHFLLWGSGYRTREAMESLLTAAGLALIRVTPPDAEGRFQVLEARPRRVVDG
jgi:hypothetical protein